MGGAEPYSRPAAMPIEQDTVDRMLAQWARERPELEVSGMAIVLRVQLLADVWSERLKETLAPAGLAPWEFEVLSALRRTGPGGLAPKDLSESARLTSGAMTHRLDRLEERGLVRRKSSRHDRRSMIVSLTPKGAALIDSVIGVRMADASASVSGLGKRAQRELARLLRDLSLSLEG